MGSVDLNNLTWGLFWAGVVFILVMGGLFSFGVVRIFQKRTVQGIISIILSIVVLVVFLNFANSQ